MLKSHPWAKTRTGVCRGRLTAMTRPAKLVFSQDSANSRKSISQEMCEAFISQSPPLPDEVGSVWMQYFKIFHWHFQLQKMWITKEYRQTAPSFCFATVARKPNTHRQVPLRSVSQRPQEMSVSSYKTLPFPGPQTLVSSSLKIESRLPWGPDLCPDY